MVGGTVAGAVDPEDEPEDEPVDDPEAKLGPETSIGVGRADCPVQTMPVTM